MSLYAAIDLHSTNNVLAIIDQSDQLIRSKRLPNELPQVLQELAPYREQLADFRRAVQRLISSSITALICVS